MTGSTSVAVLGLDGRLVSAVTHQWAVDGVVTDGIAAAEKSRSTTAEMPALALADDNPLAKGTPNARRLLSAKDGKGDTQDFVVVNSDEGLAKTMVHLVNGKIGEAYSFEWKKVQGGWLAKSFAVTVFKDGKPITKIRSVNRKLAPMLADPTDCSLDPNCDPFAGGGGAGGGGGGGGGDGGGGYFSACCQTQLEDYLAAASQAAIANQLAIETGTILTFWGAAAVVAMWARAALMLSRYNSCYQQYCVASTGTLTTGAFFAAVDPFDPKYFRRGLT